jgi:hypothetical protein
MRRSSRVAIIAAANLAWAGSASVVLAQGRMIALSATAVQQGQPVRVKSPPCAAGQPSTLVDGKLFPSKPADGDLELTTASLASGTHLITTTCGDVASDPVSLTIVPPNQVRTPTVDCARNASPRDDLGEPLTTTARKAEAERIEKVKQEAKGASQAHPTAAELSFQTARCDKDWTWTFRLEDTLSLNVSGFSEWKAVGENARTDLHFGARDLVVSIGPAGGPQ